MNRDVVFTLQVALPGFISVTDLVDAEGDNTPEALVEYLNNLVGDMGLEYIESEATSIRVIAARMGSVREVNEVRREEARPIKGTNRPAPSWPLDEDF